MRRITTLIAVALLALPASAAARGRHHKHHHAVAHRSTATPAPDPGIAGFPGAPGSCERESEVAECQQLELELEAEGFYAL